jgi:hypothetical protein
MRKKTFLSVMLLTTLLVAALFLLNSSAPAEKKETPTCCKQRSMKECPENNTNSSGEMIIENLSRQFISITAFSN